MDKRVILAVAGAGKTYYICHTINPEKKNLILAYTNENIYNIKKELCDAHGCVPALTTVMTFDSFVYRYLICPYEPTIAEYFECSEFVSCGICTIEPPPQRIPNKYGNMVPNGRYIVKDKLGHYVTRQGQYYCSTLSELVMQVKTRQESLVKRVAYRMNLFYDQVLIDEFQDFRERDFDLIMAISKLLDDVILVGDYHQHSVSATNNSGKPFKRKKNNVGYNEFIDGLKREGFKIDVETLDKSRRCSTEICNYIKKKLGINIESHDGHQGAIIWADDYASEIIENPDIVKLVFKDAACYTFRAMNWSYSKGDTVDSACVILTDKFETLDDESFSTESISISTINKLYVAMTRSCGNLYLLKASTFKKIKDTYEIM